MIRFTPTPHVDTLIDLALAEDIGCGDATADALIPIGQMATMNLVARENIVVCGQPIVDRVLMRFGPLAMNIEWNEADGAEVDAGTVLARVSGLLSEMLILERTILNFLQRMSGVATHTRRYVDAIAGTNARLVDTRKTLPGYRTLDKYATRVGGASNHRASLDGGVLIKDNHLEAAGGVEGAIEKARTHASHSLRIEIEVETMDDFHRAIRSGADVIMLDNFSPAQLREAAQFDRKGALLEASGGITLDNIREYAEAGADLIAVGALTHSAPSVDIAGDIVSR